MNREGPKDRFGRIAVLDGFRALAILSVMAFHYTVRWTAPYDVPPHLPVRSPFVGFVPFQYGWMGVELFFVISGFVILMTLKRSRTVFDFACRRVARLWPALIVGAAFTALVVDLFGPPDLKVGPLSYATSLILVDPHLLNRAGLHVQWVDAVYWTLWVEVRFYVLAAILYFSAPRHFLKVWLTFQLLVTGAFFIVPRSLMELVAIPGFLPYFTIGICVFELWSRTSERKLAIGGALFAALFILCDAAFRLDVFAVYSPLPSICGNLLIFALFSLFLFDHPVLRPFASKPMIAIGQASYSLYLIHQVIGLTLLRHLLGLPFVVSVLLVAALCIGVSLCLFKFVEVPSKRWLMRYLHAAPKANLTPEEPEPAVEAFVRTGATADAVR